MVQTVELGEIPYRNLFHHLKLHLLCQQRGRRTSGAVRKRRGEPDRKYLYQRAESEGTPAKALFGNHTYHGHGRRPVRLLLLPPEGQRAGGRNLLPYGPHRRKRGHGADLLPLQGPGVGRAGDGRTGTNPPGWSGHAVRCALQSV